MWFRKGILGKEGERRSVRSPCTRQGRGNRAAKQGGHWEGGREGLCASALQIDNHGLCPTPRT